MRDWKGEERELQTFLARVFIRWWVILCITVMYPFMWILAAGDPDNKGFFEDYVGLVSELWNGIY